MEFNIQNMSDNELASLRDKLNNELKSANADRKKLHGRRYEWRLPHISKNLVLSM